MQFRNLTFALILILFSGCSFDPRIALPLQEHLSTSRGTTTGACAALFVATQTAITSAAVIDNGAVRISGYPYLRVNRFLASFRHEISDQQFEAWIDLLQKLAMQGWHYEVANLPAADRQTLDALWNNNKISAPTLNAALQYCAAILRKHDLNNEFGRATLQDRASVPDNYITWQRIIGLYPLTALAFKAGINDWHEQTREIFRQPLPDLTISGKLVEYNPITTSPPLSSTEIARLIAKSSRNPLHIPHPDHSDRQRLLDNFSPILVIDEESNADRIGTPVWQKGKEPLIDTTQPVLYRHLSHTRLNDQILLQLNYSFWFPERPKTSSLDLLGGHLDGITWRVTLLPDGNPWLFDTMHNCGCYHLFFPTQYARFIEQKSLYQEPAFAPQQLQVPNPPARPVLRIAATTHYLQRVTFISGIAEQTKHYQTANANNLRSLPLPDGNYRNLFGQDGIITSSERGERFLFWPMGIANPGAMRQWGHHATAFVGRRHFDDARLFENSFAINNP
jgi:hypothetical protein